MRRFKIASTEGNNWLTKHREATSYLRETTKTIDRLRVEINSRMGDQVNLHHFQDKFPPLILIANELGVYIAEVARLKAELENVKEILGNYKVLEDIRRATYWVNRVVEIIGNRFVRLHQFYRLSCVTLTAEHGKVECVYCLFPISSGTIARACPNCEKFYHNECVSDYITRLCQRECVICLCFIHL